MQHCHLLHLTEHWAHSTCNRLLLFRALIACTVEQYSCKCPSISTEDYFIPIFLLEVMEELLNDTRLLKKFKKGKITEEEFEKGLLTSGKRSTNKADLEISDLEDDCWFPPLRWNAQECGMRGAGPHSADSSSFLLLNIRTSAAVGSCCCRNGKCEGFHACEHFTKNIPALKSKRRKRKFT